VGATTITAIHGSRANRAGSFFECAKSASVQATKCLSAMNRDIPGDTYAKRPINI